MSLLSNMLNQAVNDVGKAVAALRSFPLTDANSILAGIADDLEAYMRTIQRVADNPETLQLASEIFWMTEEP